MTDSWPDVCGCLCAGSYPCKLAHQDVLNGCYPVVREREVINGMEGSNYIVRKLTPLECCRLQAFPDWYCDGVQGSESAQYKMWGNGMTLTVIAYVMYGIAEALEREELEEM